MCKHRPANYAAQAAQLVTGDISSLPPRSISHPLSQSDLTDFPVSFLFLSASSMFTSLIMESSLDMEIFYHLALQQPTAIFLLLLIAKISFSKRMKPLIEQTNIDYKIAPQLGGVILYHRWAFGFPPLQISQCFTRISRRTHPDLSQKSLILPPYIFHNFQVLKIAIHP